MTGLLVISTIGKLVYTDGAFCAPSNGPTIKLFSYGHKKAGRCCMTGA